MHLVVHPQFVVRRDLDGRLLELVGLGLEELREVPPDAVVESWMHIEIDRETDAADLAAIEAALARVLRDVRETVEDWPRMTRTASSIAEELAAAPPPSVPADEVAEAVELLHWLADNNFTFLGYREYDLSGADGEDEPVRGVRDGPGDPALGHRSEPGVRAAAGSGPQRRPRAARARADQGEHPLDGAPPRLPRLHRHQAVRRRRQGERRAPVPRPVHLGRLHRAGLDHPGLRTQGPRRAGALGLPPRQPLRQGPAARSSRPTRATSCSRSTVEEPVDTSLAVLHMQERRQTRLFLRRDPYGRFVSALVFLPRDRYTTAGPAADGAGAAARSSAWCRWTTRPA